MTAALKQQRWRADECVEDDCHRVPLARNLCSRHYQQRKARGIPLPDKVRVPLAGVACSTDGCLKPARAFGLCQRHAQLSRRYGLAGDELTAIDQAVCAVCRTDKELHVDHCHTTGEVRGVLCRGCNTALGLLGDDLGRIVRLAAYLEASR